MTSENKESELGWFGSLSIWPENDRWIGIDLHAQLHSCDFYRRLGFSVCSSVFDEAGIPHVRMFRDLTGSK